MTLTSDEVGDVLLPEMCHVVNAPRGEVLAEPRHEQQVIAKRDGSVPKGPQLVQVLVKIWREQR